MAVLRAHSNNYGSTTNGAINNSVTTIVVTSATGLPTVNGSQTCNLTLDTLSGVVEIVTVTAISGNTLTVTRGAEGTTAVSWANGSVIQLRPTANSLDRKADLTSPVLVTPNLGTPSAGVLTSCTGLPETGLSFTDITTANASTSQHGLLPKLDNVVTHFLNGQGGWTIPSGGGGGSGGGLDSYTTTVTAAGTTTLTVSSNYQQFFTGTTTQTLAMPVTSTLVLGQSWLVVNNSTGVVTAQSSGANTIIAMAGNTQAVITCTSVTGTTAASWNYEYIVNSYTGTGSAVLSTSATLVTPALGTPTSGTLTNCTGLPEGGLSTTDITTNNATTSKHGFLKKLNNDATYYMDGSGNWSVPASGSSIIVAGTANQINSALVGNTYTLSFPNNIVMPGTDATTMPTGTSAQRSHAGIRFNSDLNRYEGIYAGYTSPNFIIDDDFSGTGVMTRTGTAAYAIVATTGSGSIVKATSGTLVTPILGTPTSGTLTNCTGLPISTGVSGLGTGVATFLGSASSANLASAMTDETGTGALVFANTPTLVTPVLGTPNSGNLTNCTSIPAGQLTGQALVANGGTGLASTTAYAVLCGGTTSTGALQSIASVGTSGQVLTSNGAGALPTFQAAGASTTKASTTDYTLFGGF